MRHRKTARIAEISQLAGRFRRWWQVLGSNQRRLSRRFTVFRSYSHHIAADLRKRRHSASAAPTLSAICSCTRASRRPHRTDSHGHCPQNRLTCANQQAEPCAPKRIQPGRTCAKADEPLIGGGYHSIPTRPRHYPPTPDTRTPQADGALALPAKPA